MLLDGNERGTVFEQLFGAKNVIFNGGLRVGVVKVNEDWCARDKMRNERCTNRMRWDKFQADLEAKAIDSK